ncbi:HDOD domain-containing protein [Rubinisphaera margarita]|uniref:HDOD domain-containing protein n=1 Tax=Rubinisphaera margarita TaxID=2909586 RepID=UPI001EE793D4|nr:HDOD domain-containing protein [Rubinisphaera margarita]MCG6157162.1 HDOD domain-containing protein [Rubinisphaera margarita]
MDWLHSCKEILREADGQTLPPKFKLPVLPTAITEFAKRSNDPEVSAGDLARILESDSGLTADILQLVNSSTNGLRCTVSSVKQAISLLGFKKVQSFVLTVGAKRAMSRCDSRLINLSHFWSTNLERALFAREIAGLLRVDPEIAFAGAMLQDFLLPALTSALLNGYGVFVDERSSHPRMLIDFEQQRFGWHHAKAAAHVAWLWNFPGEIVCGIYHHHQGAAILLDPEFGQTTVAAVALSSLLPDALNQTPDGLDSLLTLQEHWPQFDLQLIAERIAAGFYEMGGNQNYHITLHKRLTKRHTRAKAVC